MHCPQCPASIRPGEPICARCGSVLACPDCGFPVSPDARFCGGCGKPLAPAPAAPLPVAAAPNADAAAERRQITVMFCELAESTPARRGPEDRHEIIRLYQRICAGIIAGFGGYVAQYLGEGLMVYFGYPKAHEDDPERAVHAGLRIVRAVAALRPGLGTRLGDTADLYPVLRGLVSFWIVRGELQTALELSESCLRLARETQRPDYLIEAYNSMGYSLAYLGSLKAGAGMLAEGVRVYLEADGERLSFPSPHDPRMGCASLLTVVLWMLGDARQAIQYHQNILEVLERRRRPFDLTYGHFYSSLFETFRGRHDSAARYAAYSRDVAARNGYQFWFHGNSLLLAAAKGRLGETGDEVIGMLKDGLAGWRASGGEMFLTYGFAVLAETYSAAGRIGEALAAIEEGIAQADRYREYLFRSMLYRIRGDLRALAGDAAGAAGDLWRAVEMAREQEAQLLELQAALSLYQLDPDSARPESARSVLERATEQLAARGYPDIPELQEAERRLAESRTRPGNPSPPALSQASAASGPSVARIGH